VPVTGGRVGLQAASKPAAFSAGQSPGGTHGSKAADEPPDAAGRFGLDTDPGVSGVTHPVTNAVASSNAAPAIELRRMVPLFEHRSDHAAVAVGVARVVCTPIVRSTAVRLN
jgi:hypothetical protein